MSLRTVIASPFQRAFLGDAPRWVVIRQRYYCGCVKKEKRAKATGTDLPTRCPEHGAGWEWIETVDAENVKE